MWERAGMCPERVETSARMMRRTFLVFLPLVVWCAGCGPSTAQRVEQAAKVRWHAQSASCVRRSSVVVAGRSGELYRCILGGASIPIQQQFTDDFMASTQHRYFLRTETRIADIS